MRLLLACALSVGLAAPLGAANLALALDGRGDYVHLPDDLFAGLDEMTVAFWTRWDETAYFSQPFASGSGDRWQAWGINNFERDATLQFFAYHGQPDLALISAPHYIHTGTWHHVAVVSGPDGMRLYVDGILAGH